ncbi:MAG: gamma-glutamyltransferase [Gammaproteobacteria bacterium]|nr:gamma-glutamyltransferase [Gammaproteobacteria bacterium]
MIRRITVPLLGMWLCMVVAPAGAGGDPQAADPPGDAIASAHPLATRAGLQVLAEGGNAFDAAVTVSAVLAVVEPWNSGLGGGGFWLLHRGSDGYQVMIDGREQAPGSARRDMYLGDDGEPVADRSRNGALAAGIPGTAAALAHLAQRYGTLPLPRLLAPAIRIARDGFAVGPAYQDRVQRRESILRRFPETVRIFFDDGFAPEAGWVLRQPELAETLERFAQGGAPGFYAGTTAKRLVAASREAGGIWSLEDFAAYQVKERTPISGTFRGQDADGREQSIRLVSAPPPSSGGIVLLQALNVLADRDRRGPPPVHRVVEAMRLAYRDRARYLGDDDFVTIDTAKLLSPDYAAALRRAISERAMAPDRLPDPLPSSEQGNTTHYSILDRHGNRVAATLSINFPFGSGLTAAGTGVLLNNEMDDFSAAPGRPNVWGLVTGEANSVQPRKRPLSSMSPTFLETDSDLLILGSVGGSRIISQVLQATLAFASGEREPARLVAMPRYHHQYSPDTVFHEPGAFSEAVMADLVARGHHLAPASRRYGNMNAIRFDIRNHRLSAASDPRGEGLASVQLAGKNQNGN